MRGGIYVGPCCDGSEDSAIMREGAALGRRYAPPPRTPATLARLAAGAIAIHADNITAGLDLAHRPTALQRALIAWGRACDVETRAGRGLPEWPRWHEVRRSPFELATILVRVEGDAARVERLGEDVKAWARQWDAMQEPEEVTT
jgi:hypothetical protein